jgi:hypothetical protein
VSATGAETTASDSTAGQSPRAAVHVVINPSSTAGLTPVQQALLLAHEDVHVVTSGHPVAAGRDWVSEGTAEWVALGLDPATAAQSTQLARDACQSAGLTPPSDTDLTSGDATDQQQAYAISWRLVGLLHDHLEATAAQADVVALWAGDPTASPGILDDLATWSAQWCHSA